MIHGADDIDTTGERFAVQCPTCEEWFGTYSPMMVSASRSCSCGTVFKTDLENEQAGEIIE